MVVLKENGVVVYDSISHTGTVLFETDRENHLLTENLIAMDPFGKFLITFGYSSTDLWDLESREKVFSKKRNWSYRGAYYNISFHDNGTSFVAWGGGSTGKHEYSEGSWYSIGHLFEIDKIEEKPIPAHRYAPPRTYSISIQQVWNEPTRIEGVRFGRSSDELLVERRDEITLRDRRSGRILFPFRGDGIENVLMSRKHQVALVEGGGYVRQVDVSSGAELERLEVRLSGGKYVDQDHKIIASKSGSEIWVWNRLTGALLHRLVGHTRAVTAIDVNSRGEILSSSGDCTLMLWNGRSGTELAMLLDSNDSVIQCGFTADDDIVYSYTGSQLAFWSLRSKSIIKLIEIENVKMVAHPHLPLVAVTKGSRYPTHSVIELRSIYSGEALAILDLDIGEDILCNASDFSADGKTLLIAGNLVTSYSDYGFIDTSNGIIALLDVTWTSGVARANH